MGDSIGSPKCVIIGSSGSGKSTLLGLYRAATSHQEQDGDVIWVTTRSGALLGVEVLEFNDVSIKEGENHSLLMRGDAYVLVYSVTDETSLEFIKTVMRELDYRRKKRKIRFILIGNKCDLESERTVSREEGQLLANDCKNSLYFETSGEQTSGITSIFTKVADLINNRDDLETDVSCNCAVQ